MPLHRMTPTLPAMPSLMVRDGVITLPVGGLGVADRAKAVQLLAEIPGVNAVKTTETTGQQPVNDASGPVQVPADETVSATESVILPTGLLPAGHLFKPLLADPRWAHFSAAYRNAVDIKNFEENNWSTDVSARAGVEFDNLQVLGRKLQILVEYFNGFSPSGQFYKNKVEYIGLGAHYHF
ncbi:MAG: DUF1207 domain-containing protein [Methylococcales bacterium]